MQYSSTSYRWLKILTILSTVDSVIETLVDSRKFIEAVVSNAVDVVADSVEPEKVANCESDNHADLPEHNFGLGLPAQA